MYKTINDLPEPIRTHIPDEALQAIYLKAYNRSWDDYEEFRGGDAGREAVAHRDAMNAVKRDHVYSMEDAHWYPKGEMPDFDEKEEQGFLDMLAARLNLG